MKRQHRRWALLLCGGVLSGCALFFDKDIQWSAEELRTLRSLWLESLPPLEPDPSNRYGDDLRAAELGRLLFFDKRLSANNKVSCASCHQPENYFSDKLPVSRGISLVTRNAPTLIGASYSPWFYWDGRRDSQWSQALVPLETSAEHGIDRRWVLEVIASDTQYHQLYRNIFRSDPNPELLKRTEIDNAFANVSKSIAAFQRQLQPSSSRFDDYVNELFGGGRQREPLTDQELKGMKLFIGEQAQCTRCHNGPLFTNFGFHNIGLVELKRGVFEYDFGRKQAIEKVLGDPFNCVGEYSDAGVQECIELNYIKTTGRELLGAFKVLGLRNVAETAPYMHDGRFETLEEVVEHYQLAPVGRAGHQELNPITLDENQLAQLVAFLKTLSGKTPYFPGSSVGNQTDNAHE